MIGVRRLAMNLSRCSSSITRSSSAMITTKRTWFGFGVPKPKQPALPDKPSYMIEGIDDADLFDPPMPEDERRDRHELFTQILAHADANKQITYDLVKKSIDLLMKYDDRVGVKAARELGFEAGIQFEKEYLDRIDSYLYDANLRAMVQEDEGKSSNHH